ncbi:MAG: AAA family ATPase, partial [Thermodesulfobacteriota bacterium]|nr:AAA family ATPase [Thermodesulfobacteriota bacterium]
MYTDFYNLKEKPFNLSPSPRFLYLGDSHKEALALLSYGVTERKGFILLTGEVGTGKTTMIQALLSNLDYSVKYVYLSNPILSSKEFMDYLAFSAFKKKIHFKSKTDFLLEFEGFLEQCLQHQEIFILIVDEAQRLSFDLLEEIRLLSNMESAEEKLINIFLVGQPELNVNLSDPRCRAILQRISIRYNIEPLNLEETREYIGSRLETAGAKKGDDIFSKDSIKAIYNYSQGYPRMINILADNAMLLGYSKEKRKITPSMIKQCYDDMSLNDSFLKKNLQRSEPDDIKKHEPIPSRRHWKWAVLLFFIIMIVAIGMSQSGQNILWELSKIVTFNHEVLVDKVAKEKRLLKKEKKPGKIERVDANPMKDPVLPVIQTGKNRLESRNIKQPEEPKNMERSVPHVSGEKNRYSDIVEEEKPEKIEKSPPQASGEKNRYSDIVEEEKPEGMEKLFPEEDKKSFKTVIVKQGDTLDQLSIGIYNRADQKIFNLVKKHNPEIKDINKINVGQTVIFPPLPISNGGPVYTVHIASFQLFSHAQDLFKKLMREGYFVSIRPGYSERKEKIFRVILGNFESQRTCVKLETPFFRIMAAYSSAFLWLSKF